MAINKIGGIAALLLGLTSCYNSPVEEKQTERNYVAVDGGKDAGSKTAPFQMPSECREWVVGPETLTMCEYDANNDGRRDSVIKRMSNPKEVRMIKAYDTNGDGTYDLVVSDESVLKMPEVEIIPGIPNSGKPQKQEIFL